VLRSVAEGYYLDLFLEDVEGFLGVADISMALGYIYDCFDRFRIVLAVVLGVDSVLLFQVVNGCPSRT
jgi:hypothetical protein